MNHQNDPEMKFVDPVTGSDLKIKRLAGNLLRFTRSRKNHKWKILRSIEQRALYTVLERCKSSICKTFLRELIAILG